MYRFPLTRHSAMEVQLNFGMDPSFAFLGTAVLRKNAANANE